MHKHPSQYFINTRPSKRFGQNFLVNTSILDTIIEAAALTKDDVVLEVGPGLGVLTQALARHAKKVIAIEKDRAMVSILQENLKDFHNVEIIQADALSYKVESLPSYKVVANIPAGEVMTYGQVAEAVGRPGAARAVGNVMSRNFNPDIPCHRVVRAGGKLGEYNRGRDRKLYLLKKEGVRNYG